MYPGESKLKKRNEWGFLWAHCCPLTGLGQTHEICRACNGIANRGYAIQLYLIEEGEPIAPDSGNFDSWDFYGCKHHALLKVKPQVQKENCRAEDYYIEGPIWYSPFAAVLLPPPAILATMENFHPDTYIEEQLARRQD